MTSYLLMYDLTKEQNSADYQPLWDELASWAAQRTQYSAWLVSDNSTAENVHDHFRQFLDKTDRLWVCEIVRNKRYSQAIAGTKDWLTKNPPAR